MWFTVYCDHQSNNDIRQRSVTHSKEIFQSKRHYWQSFSISKAKTWVTTWVSILKQIRNEFDNFFLHNLNVFCCLLRNLTIISEVTRSAAKNLIQHGYDPYFAVKIVRNSKLNSLLLPRLAGILVRRGSEHQNVLPRPKIRRPSLNQPRRVTFNNSLSVAIVSTYFDLLEN